LLCGLYAAKALAIMTDAALAILLPWLILNQTGSVLWVGGIAALVLSAILIGALCTPRLVTHCGVRRLIVIASLVDVLSIIGLTVCFLMQPLHLVAITVIACAGAVLDTARDVAAEARLPEIARLCRVPLAKLNGRGEACDTLATIAGPACVGVGWALTNSTTVVLGLAATALLSALLFVLVFPRFRHHDKRLPEPSVWTAIRGLWYTPQLRLPLAVTVIVLATIASLDDLIVPTFIHQRGGQPGHISILLGTFASGSVVGAFYYAERCAGSIRPALLAVGILGIGVFFATLVLASSQWLLLGSVFGAGLLSGPLGPMLDTELLRHTAKRSRVSALAGMALVALAGSPLIIVLHAVLIDWLGLVPVLILLAGICVVAAAWAATFSPAPEDG
jgi:macrolide resistance protein